MSLFNWFRSRDYENKATTKNTDNQTNKIYYLSNQDLTNKIEFYLSEICTAQIQMDEKIFSEWTSTYLKNQNVEFDCANLRNYYPQIILNKTPLSLSGTIVATECPYDEDVRAIIGIYSDKYSIKGYLYDYHLAGQSIDRKDLGRIVEIRGIGCITCGQPYICVNNYTPKMLLEYKECSLDFDGKGFEIIFKDR